MTQPALLKSSLLTDLIDICQLLSYAEQIFMPLSPHFWYLGVRIRHAHRLVIAGQLSSLPAGPPMGSLNLNLHSFLYL